MVLTALVWCNTYDVRGECTQASHIVTDSKSEVILAFFHVMVPAVTCGSFLISTPASPMSSSIAAHILNEQYGKLAVAKFQGVRFAIASLNPSAIKPRHLSAGYQVLIHCLGPTLVSREICTLLVLICLCQSAVSHRLGSGSRLLRVCSVKVQYQSKQIK